MVDKNVFTQELNKVFTILQELRVVEKYIKELIDSNNLTEDKLVEIEEKLNQYKRDLDYINENTEQLQESLNQMNIDLGDVIKYIDSIKDYIRQSENLTEVGGDLEVTGTLRVNSNISAKNMNISGELTLPSANSLVFEDGSTIGGGSGKYLHKIEMILQVSSWPSTRIYFDFVTNDETPLTIDTLKTFLSSNYNQVYIEATGTHLSGSYDGNAGLASKTYIVQSIYYNSGYKISGILLTINNITINETTYRSLKPTFENNITLGTEYIKNIIDRVTPL